MNRSGYGWAGAAVRLPGGLSAVASARAEPAADSLYIRIGGEQKMHAIVEEFVEAVWVEPSLEPFYKGVTRSRFKEHLQQQICNMNGGDCVCEGDCMRAVHAGNKIRQADFYRLVEVLRHPLQHQNVPLRQRNEMLTILAPMPDTEGQVLGSKEH
ncbi:MAG: group 1 truncated hemoglobin [Steroidobacteraceae bacterium]